jgi:hypothetical protein
VVPWWSNPQRSPFLSLDHVAAKLVDGDGESGAIKKGCPSPFRTMSTLFSFCLDCSNVLCLKPFRAFRGVELYSLAFLQAAKSASLICRIFSPVRSRPGPTEICSNYLHLARECSVQRNPESTNVRRDLLATFLQLTSDFGYRQFKERSC